MGEDYERLKAIADKAEAERNVKISGVQAKLLGRLRNRFVPVAFEDGEGGNFTINIRVPSPEQRKRIYELRYEVVVALKDNDTDKLEALEIESRNILADLCVDPSLDADFWKTGRGFDVEVPARLMNVAMGIEAKEREAASFFRGLSPGAGPSADAPVDRSHP